MTKIKNVKVMKYIEILNLLQEVKDLETNDNFKYQLIRIRLHVFRLLATTNKRD